MEPNSSQPDTKPPRQLQSPEAQAISSAAPQDELDRQERIAYLQSLQKGQKPKKRWPKWLALIIVIVLVCGGGAYYWFVMRKPAAKPVAQQKTTTTTAPIPDAAQPIKTKHHDSTNFSLGFDYPDTWAVTDDGSGKLTLKSTPLQLKDTTGKAMTAQVVFTIQARQSSLDAFKNGNATAVLDSEKIAYAKPTPTQRAQTYLSFLNYASSTATGLDGIYVTGDFGYQKEQAIPLVDISKADPLITITFLKCATATSCDQPATPLTISTTNWGDTTYLDKVVKTVLTSLTVQ